jgi:hypothetical protein
MLTLSIYLKPITACVAEMIRRIEVEHGEARRTAALMGMVVILSLAICGVTIMRGLAVPCL